MLKKGWKRSQVKEIASIYGRIGFRGYTKDDIVDEYCGAISLSPANIVDNKINTSVSTFISWFKYNESPEIMLKKGDVVMVKTGSTYGKSAYVDELNWKMTINPQIIVFKNIKINKKLFAYLIQSKEFQKQVEATIVGGAIPTLSQNQISSFEIEYPEDTSEQEKIAASLSDMDELIFSVKELAEKKKAMKQGVMQELLTGKKRLNGFCGEVKKQRLGDLCTICRGGSPRPIQKFLTDSENGINWIKIGDAGADEKYINSTTEKIDRSGVSMSRRVYKGDFILSNSMSFGRPYILNIDGCIHDGWLTIQNYQKYFNIDYLYYLLSSEFVKKQYVQMAAGSSVQNLNKEKVGNVIVYVPKMEEQNAIASILSDIDKELNVLNKKLEKYKKLKQGMMSEMLTGNIRVI